MGQEFYRLRLNKLKRKMQEYELDYLFVLKPENRYYLSGFDGSSGFLLISQDQQYLVTDFRYIDQAKSQTSEFKLILQTKDEGQEIASLLAAVKGGTLGFEEHYLNYKQYRMVKERLPLLQMIPVYITEELRLVKEETEINRIKDSVNLAEAAYNDLIKVIQPGWQEKEVAAELEYFMRQKGSAGVAFDTIVASGWRSSLPHGSAGERRLKSGELVVIDFGAVYKGYCSDMTRTLAVDGDIPEELLKIYDIVKEAHDIALKKIKPGLEVGMIDRAGREIIEYAGYGRYFGHSLGHGIGLEVHEEPRVSINNKTKLEVGMVFSVEPGVYLPMVGGVRIEDLVVVREKGVEILNQVPSSLLII